MNDKIILKDGGVVIDTEVDNNNQLHYIVQRGDEVTTEKVSGNPNTPIFIPHISSPKKITIEVKE